MDNDGVLWTMNDTEGSYTKQPFGTKISNPQKAKLQPGLSGNGCNPGLMVSDTQGGIWTNMGHPTSLTKVMTTKDGKGVIQYDASDNTGFNQLIIRPNLIAEGTSFMVADNQRHIFGFSWGTSVQTEQITANTDVLVFEGSEYIDDTNGTSIKGARVDRNGTLTVTDAASSSGGPTFVLKGQKLNPYQYIPEFSHILYGTEGGTYEVDTYSTGKGSGIKARITPGRILRGDTSSGFYLLTDQTGVLYLSGASKITSPVKFLPDSTTVNGDYADVFAIGVDHHVYQINADAKSVSDTGIIVNPSLHAGTSGQTGPVVKYTLSDNVTADPVDAASNVKVTSSTGSTVPAGWSASFTGRTVTVTFPSDWTVPDGATYDVNVNVKPTKTGRVLAASDGTLTWNTGSSTYDDLYVTGAAPLAASMPATGIPQSDAIRFAGITAGLGCVTVSLRRRRMKA